MKMLIFKLIYFYLFIFILRKHNCVSYEGGYEDLLLSGGGVRMWNYIDKSQRFGGWTASVFRVEEYKKLHVTYWQAAFFEISLI